jgi:hypothetical protein
MSGLVDYGSDGSEDTDDAQGNGTIIILFLRILLSELSVLLLFQFIFTYFFFSICSSDAQGNGMWLMSFS